MTETENYHGYKTFQEFLDNSQYTRNGILRYEQIFGTDFISTGGITTTKDFVKLLDLKSGQKVLDVGAGIGGSAFHMAKEYGVTVEGIDLSSNMIEIAKERAEKYKDDRVSFEIADVTTQKYSENSFDVIYSRDTILHIADKEALFSLFLKWLKPGGKLLITDYCCSDGEQTEDFKKYVAQRGYYLVSPRSYGKILEKVGFTKVVAEDRKDQFLNVLKGELDTFSGIKEHFIQQFSEADYKAILDGWQIKLERVGRGEQCWGFFMGQKQN